MIISKIFYFYLLSRLWMVGARGPLDDFKDATDTVPNWTAAYNNIDPNLLDNFSQQSIQQLHSRVEIHLNHIYTTGNNAGLPVESHPYYGLPKLVYLIRNSNIRVLNEVKSSLGPGYGDPLLENINDRYVEYMSTLYHVMNRQHVPIQTYLIDVAVLNLLNKRMLRNYAPYPELARLQSYHDMIQQMHIDLARFMQTFSQSLLTSIDRFDDLEQLETRINSLAASNIDGYRPPEIQARVYHLAHRILYTIVMHGGSPEHGSPMISGLLNPESHKAVRFFLNLDIRTYLPLERPFERPFQRLLHNLATGLTSYSDLYPLGNPWFQRLQQMVETMTALGNVN
jgi:hypothetical protein